MRRIWGGLLLLLLLVGCGGSGGGGGGSTATPSVITDPFLFDHNASINGGVLTRWPSVPVTVDTGQIPDAEAKFNRWRDATGGSVSFVFTGAGAGVRVRLGGAIPDTCAETVVFFTAGGSVTRAEVSLTPIWNTAVCVETVAHEAGHSIGFFGHTSDGGLMDPDGGNGQITGQVANMMRTLYSNPPGTMVKSALLARGAQTPRDGIRSVRFVTPARYR